jgi:hypothetical protein
MVIRDSIEVNATPEAIFRFFEEMDARYLRWHPDHRLFRWVRGQRLEEGNVFYFEEQIAGKLLKKQVVLTRVVPNECISFSPTFWVMRVFLPRMTFRIEPQASRRCRVVAEIQLRIGPLAAKLNKRELAAVREHMRVESMNLRQIVEAG